MVKVVIKATRESVEGKFVSIEAGTVNLFSGIMSDKKGGFRGCGRKRTFQESAVRVAADDPAREVRRR
ncbi:MAG: hypothetical protein HY660_11775 [Armatimonadetes bacterium]|nr:hypothetical protein [Armatimonadota bacterium]